MTMIELVAFIAVASIVAVAMVKAFSLTMRGSVYGKELTQGTQLAQQRMEVILGQRKRLTYANFTAANYDPCQLGLWAGPPQACSTSTYASGASYGVTSTGSFAVDTCGAGTGTNCRLITVTVTSPFGDVLTRLTAQVWNY